MYYTKQTFIVVVKFESDHRTVMIGMVVDSVTEVLNIRGDEIESTPSFGAGLNTDCIPG